MQRKFPTYGFDEGFRVKPGPDTETANFIELKRLLLSKDLSQYGLLEKMTKDGRCLFLDRQTDLAGDRVAFQSFVRSGNTFLRRYIEQITGVYTGDDMSINITFF